MTATHERIEIRTIDTGTNPERFGWHCLGLAKDFRDGRPHQIEVFGTEVVVFADSTGEIHVLETPETIESPGSSRSVLVTVAAVVEETGDARSLVFDVPADRRAEFGGQGDTRVRQPGREIGHLRAGTP